MKKTIFFSSLFFFACLLIGCASSPMIQPQINSLVVAERFDLAEKALANNVESYGPHNELLFWLDKGVVAHAAGNYRDSIAAFERAKQIYDQLYTISLSKELSTWIINDNTAPYRGEDFERAMMAVYQALNFVALEDYEEALVEARDVDNKLRLFNERYGKGAENVYREDAFVRLLMGLIYEAVGTEESINDAYISYHKALETYQTDYIKNYDILPPKLLVENLWAAKDYTGFPDDALTDELGKVRYASIKEKQKKAQVILVHFQGHSPIKHAAVIPIPLPNANIAKLTFPVYEKRIDDDHEYELIAKRDDQIISQTEGELAQDIEAIAIQNLQNRLARVITKAILRTGIKQGALYAVEDSVRDEYGHTAGDVAKIAGNIVAYYSEQADLRAWQTLPAQICLSRLILEPGQYSFYLNDKQLQSMTLEAGEVKFLFARTSR